MVPKRFAPPVVVLELMLGIVVGPELLGLAHSDEFIEFFSNLGLGMLFFFAGYEIDFNRIKGRPMKLGAWGWLLSVALAYGIGGILAAAGIVLSFLYTGSAMATTAIGTLIPILRDNGELKTKFGTYLLAAGGAGEFGPILLVTLVLSTASPLHESAILLAFIALALFLALLSVRYAWRGWPALERTFESSSQLAVRVTVVLVFGLVLLANKLGLDLLLGGFVAGMIVRVALQGHELQVFESKLTAVGFGFFVPFFFVTSGIEFDLAALGSAEALAKLVMFFGLFLVVRGTPAMLLYRGVLGARDRAALAFYSATELPLVVAITTIATETGHMRTLDRGRPGRRRDALDPGLPLRRAGAAQGQRGRGRPTQTRRTRTPPHLERGPSPSRDWLASAAGSASGACRRSPWRCRRAPSRLKSRRLLLASLLRACGFTSRTSVFALPLATLLVRLPVAALRFLSRPCRESEQVRPTPAGQAPLTKSRLPLRTAVPLMFDLSSESRRLLERPLAPLPPLPPSPPLPPPLPLFPGDCTVSATLSKRVLVLPASSPVPTTVELISVVIETA